MIATFDELDRLRDRHTIEMLEATSSTVALILARREERLGWPAYDADPDPFARRRVRVGPRDVPMVCAHCGVFFWADGQNAHHQRYCTGTCRQKAYYRRHVAARAVA
jgi:ferredoxin